MLGLQRGNVYKLKSLAQKNVICYEVYNKSSDKELNPISNSLVQDLDNSIDSSNILYSNLDISSSYFIDVILAIIPILWDEYLVIWNKIQEFFSRK